MSHSGQAAAPAVERGVVRAGFAVLALAIRERPRPFAVAVTGAAVYGGMTVAAAVVFGQVTDRVIVPAFRDGRTTPAAVALAAAAVVAVAAVKAAGIVTRRIGAASMQVRLQADYRRRITAAYQRLPLAWHRRHSTGELLSNANADVEALFWPVAPMPFAVGVVVLLAVAFGVLLATDVVLTAVVTAVGPLLMLGNWRYNRAVRGPTTRVQQLRAEVSDVAHESIDGALVVKTLGREAAETERFRAASERLRDELVTVGRIRAVYDPLLEALPQLGVLAVLAAGAARLQAGAITTGDLVQVAYLFTLLAFPLRVIGFLFAELPRAVVGWERVRAVLQADDTLPEGRLDPGHVDAPAGAALAEVSFTYPDSASHATAGTSHATAGTSHATAGGSPAPGAGRGLTGVSLEVTPGTLVAVVGPTGAGKSTIAELLVRLADPDQGAVRLDGHDLRSLRRSALARDVALVFQHTFLFDDTVRANITLGADVDDAAVRAASALAQAEAFIAELPHGYDTVIGERGTTLSGGQRQRLALARALVRRPRLLLLDDATSNVDARVEAAILRGLHAAALPSTVVVVATRQATIAQADEVVYVAGGRVVDRGPHAELAARQPAYVHLLQAHARTGGP